MEILRRIKRFLTENIGLKILSIVGALALWLIVVNVDDPVVSKTYSGIQVEVLNTDAITEDGKTYEIIENSDVISVTVMAKRSVIEDMSKDYIKATADINNITFADTVPIEVHSTRYSDRLQSITARSRSLKLKVENRLEKQVEIVAVAKGVPAEGYVMGKIKPDEEYVTVSGPESVVSLITQARTSIDITGAAGNVEKRASLVFYDADGAVITDKMLNSSFSGVDIEVDIYETKEIPIKATATGQAAEGYAATGDVICDPASVLIAGKGTRFDDCAYIEIPSEALSVAGSSENLSKSVDITEYLPWGIIFADPAFDGKVNVTIMVGPVGVRELKIPQTNITVSNVPADQVAIPVNGESTVSIQVKGLESVLEALDASSITGVIDATKLSPRTAAPDGGTEGISQGSNDGEIIFALPDGVSLVEPVYQEVIVNTLQVSEAEGEKAPEPEEEPAAEEAEGEQNDDGDAGE